MIRSFASVETERFFRTGRSRRLPPEIRERATMRHRQLDAATVIGDLRPPPSNQLEALSGKGSGSDSIRINAQWRICFTFEGGHAHEVGIVDYH
jgi:proteic killer suppression protein